MRENRKRKMRPVPTWIYMSEAVKWALGIAVIVMLITTRVSTRPSKTTFADMKAAVTKDADLENTKTADDLLLKRFYSLDAVDYDGVVYYSPKTNMGAQELVLIRLKDRSQEETVMEAFDARVASQLDSFEGYGVDQTELLQNALVISEGNYCLLYVGAGTDEVKNAFRKAL
jgi:hypothetical protein